MLSQQLTTSAGENREAGLLPVVMRATKTLLAANERTQERQCLIDAHMRDPLQSEM